MANLAWFSVEAAMVALQSRTIGGLPPYTNQKDGKLISNIGDIYAHRRQTAGGEPWYLWSLFVGVTMCTRYAVHSLIRKE